MDPPSRADDIPPPPTRLSDAKLYDDNCILAQAVNTLNERLAFAHAPQNTQFHHLLELQEKLQASEASRAAIHRKYQELLHPTSPDSPQRLLFDELQFVQAAYTRLQRDYRILADKYYKLKTQLAAETTRVVQHQPMPAPNTTQYITPTSATGFRHPGDQHQRRTSETIVQSQLGSGPAPIATTSVPPLPTPPPSACASFASGHVFPHGIPVHAQVSTRSLPFPHHPHDPRLPPGMPFVAPPRPLRQQGATEPSFATILHQHDGDLTYMTNNGPGRCPPPTPVLLTSSPRPPKRPSFELQTQSPLIPVMEQHKKPRLETEAGRPTTTTGSDTHPADELPSLPASTDSVPASNLRSYEDCVYAIFEKDANVENGIFCGLCLGRYEREPDKLEPPDILTEPDFDYLVKHCTTEHPTAWDDLRNCRS